MCTGGCKPKIDPKEANEHGNEAPQPELKFAFSGHIVIISFLDEIVKGVCGAALARNEFADVIKVRTRNSSYVRKSNRIATQRIRSKPMEVLEKMEVDENAQQQSQETAADSEEQTAKTNDKT